MSSETVVGKTCPYCMTPIKPRVAVVICSACGMPHHAECWQENGRCTTFGCHGRPVGMTAAVDEEHDADRLVITSEDLAAQAAPPRRARPRPVEPAPVVTARRTRARPRTRRLGAGILVSIVLVLGGMLYQQLTGLLAARPSAVVRVYNQAVSRQDWPGAAHLLSSHARRELEKSRRYYVRSGRANGGKLPRAFTGVTLDRLEHMGPDEYFSIFMRSTGGGAAPALKIGSMRERITPPRATVTATDANGREVTYSLVREGLDWRIEAEPKLYLLLY
ncbi:MAG: RING finger protein [Armatimonadota bacterium]